MISIYDHSIDSTELNIYTVDFFGTDITVTVTSTPAVARRWIQATRYFNRHYYYSDRLIAGIGVQWVPGGRSSPAATLQVCVGRRCLIYQLDHVDYVPMALRRFLMSPAVTLVGIWNHSDAEKLRMSRHRVEVRELIDLRLHVRRENGENMARASVEEIVEEELGYKGVRLDYWISRSDWDDEILSVDQVRQACVDAYVSFLIGKNIRAWEI